MNNKLDPIHAVASLAIAFIEAQKDISQIRRQLDALFEQIQTVDRATATKFKEVDILIDKVSRDISNLTVIKETNNAVNTEGSKGNEINDKDLREQKSETSLLCNDK